MLIITKLIKPVGCCENFFTGAQKNAWKKHELVFAEGEKPTVVINGEDEDMNREIEALVRENGFTMEYLYTEDLLMFGERFRSSLYSFNPDGSIQCYEFMELEAA